MILCPFKRYILRNTPSVLTGRCLFFVVFILVGVMPFSFTDAQIPPIMAETFLGYGTMGVTFHGKTFSGHSEFSAVVIAIDEILACINSSTPTHTQSAQQFKIVLYIFYLYFY